MAKGQVIQHLHTRTPGAGGVHRKARMSGLTRRILGLNLLTLAVLVGGILYFNQFRSGLIETRLAALTSQAEMLAGALGESSVVEGSRAEVDLANAEAMLRRLTSGGEVRTRLFLLDGTLASDSWNFTPSTEILAHDLPPPDARRKLADIARSLWVRTVKALASDPNYPPYLERYDQIASDYPELQTAFEGNIAAKIRSTADDSVMLSVAVPIQRFRHVLGSLLVSVKTSEIEEIVRQERLIILEIFGVAVLVTVLFSIALASTIVRPVRRLAEFANQVRQGRGRDAEMPDLTHRHDEVGELSQALQDMTQALYKRIDAIENFAADVSHEIKNPLTSLRSAVETFERADDVGKQRQLISIIKDDVNRLDRLISDISNASRLDAELLRSETHPTDIRAMLQTIAQIYEVTAKDGRPSLELVLNDDELLVEGNEDHLGQVIRNLVDNAMSFGPPGSKVVISAHRERAQVVIQVEDSGPGLPQDGIDGIFERFYTERPEGEAFGTHSGLGLSIAREIVLAHDGSLCAENRLSREDDGETICGARFTVSLPALGRHQRMRTAKTA